MIKIRNDKNMRWDMKRKSRKNGKNLKKESVNLRIGRIGRSDE